jgi:hypothetical protein
VKLFSTKVHGVLDYATVITLPAVFRLLNASSGTQRLADGGAIAVLVYSLMTRYELGAFPVLSMPGHLTADAVFGAALGAAALRPSDDTNAVRGALLGLGLFSLSASLLTEIEPAPLA